MFDPKKVRVISATTTLTWDDDIVVCNNAATAITITFPSASLNDWLEITLKRASNTTTWAINIAVVAWWGTIESPTAFTFGTTTSLGTTQPLRVKTRKSIQWSRHCMQ